MSEISATKQFIKDAITGGWHPTYRTLPHLSEFRTDKEVLLDPLAWQAVGKTRGWGDLGDYPDRVYETWDHFFYDLYDGKTIEEALQAIQ